MIVSSGEEISTHKTELNFRRRSNGNNFDSNDKVYKKAPNVYKLRLDVNNALYCNSNK